MYRIYIWSCRYDHLYKVRLQIAGITKQTFVEMALNILFFVINWGRIRIVAEKSLQLLLWHYQLWKIVWCCIIRQYYNIISAGLLRNQISWFADNPFHEKCLTAFECLINETKYKFRHWNVVPFVMNARISWSLPVAFILFSCAQQNPVNCTVSRKFFCRQNSDCGFGCELHHMGICLFLAIGTNRTFIHQPDVHGFQTMMFGPLLRFSARCNKTSESFFEKLVDIKGTFQTFILNINIWWLWLHTSQLFSSFLGNILVTFEEVGTVLFVPNEKHESHHISL